MKNKIKELRKEFNQKLDALELEIIDERIDEIIEEKKNPLVPEMGQKYWIIDEWFNGGYGYCVWDNDDLDKRRLAIGNIFLTEQAVKDEIKKRTAIQTIRLYIAENFPFEPDWDDNGQIKFNIYYDKAVKRYKIETYSYMQNQTQIGFLKSEEDCKEIISKFETELDIICKVK